MWMFTGACPSHCTYCDIDSQKGKRGLSSAEVERVAEELLTCGFSEVMFVGGEPLLSPDLPLALRILKGKVRTAVFTGGLPGLADRAARVLGEGEVDRIVYSIDSGRAERNDLIRGRKGITADLLELCAAVRDRLPRLGRSVNTVVSRFNVGSLPDVWERMAPFGLDSWSLTLAGDVFEGSPGHALLTEAALELALYARGEYNATFVRRCGCPLVGIDVVIGVGGEVHPCSQGPIIHPRYVVGNVKDKPLAEILAGDALHAFGAGVPHAPCTRCWAPSNVPRETLLRLVGRASTGP
jgi:radical SAM protein with 4Fe4S-binding SPASM domain